ncbi:5-oxoprolinase subunit PxpB [Salinicoccus halodurans]|uniref:Allophanate hydrolase n=1 Tax=Salinicoccus halodurans TaxID=407035 RepID=A0A0F7HM94_9STAP|nr:5-oxoprolinase subunit PxpB [Salinicoccus halodurans]AKG74587.1 allophanate hydrolase [Salinicoccus halodurans]SFK89512.1 inhibitor of KinA [Salinicoccus halodurans]
MEISQYSENALTIYMGDDIDENVNRQLVSLKQKIEAQEIRGIEEIVISYTSLIIYFDLFDADAEEIEKAVRNIDTDSLLEGGFEYRTVEIPVCYGGEFGPDIESFKENGLTADEVIDMHSGREYLVYMLGFMPGFPYLGGLDEKLHKARLDTPRMRIPAGTVGIGGEQTGMYPFESPGGWNLLGRTPVPLFDPGREEPILYRAGDRILYRPIDEQEYGEIARQAARGEYEVKIEMRSEG